MTRKLTSLLDGISTPWGTLIPESGTDVYLSDEEFSLVTSSSIGVAWTDSGQVDSAADDVSIQADNVAAVGALTVTTVGTQTAANPAALTSTTIAAADADATYGQPEADLINELKLDYTALRVDVTAIRTQVIALVADITEIFAKFDAGVTDIGTLRTAINDILTEITGTGKAMSA